MIAARCPATKRTSAALLEPSWWRSWPPGCEAQRARAAAAWRALIARDIDRVRGLVAAFRFPGHEQVRIAEQDRPDAVQYGYERLLAMLPNFRGATEGEYTAALARCVLPAWISAGAR